MDAGSEDLAMTSQLKVGSGMECSPLILGGTLCPCTKSSLRERRAVPLGMLMVTMMGNGRTLAFRIPYVFVLYGHVRSGGNRGPQLNLKEDRELQRPSTQGTSV